VAREQEVDPHEHAAVHADQMPVALEPGAAEVPPQGVTDVVADDRADHGHDDRGEEPEQTGGGQDAPENDERLARNEEPQEGGGLQRRAEKEEQVTPATELPDEGEERVDQDATRSPDRISNSSWAARDRFAMRAMAPQ
jgi:hypothetical protein